MKSNCFIFFALVLLVCSAFAEQTKEVVQPETKGDELKQIDQRGTCKKRYCCGGYSRNRGNIVCHRYCCASSETEVEAVEEEPKHIDQRGTCKNRYCCGGYSRNRGNIVCHRYCCPSSENEGGADGSSAEVKN